MKSGKIKIKIDATFECRIIASDAMSPKHKKFNFFAVLVVSNGWIL